MKNNEMKNAVTENNDLAPDMEARIRELEDAVKRARSHKGSCDCEDCETKRDFGLSRLKGFGKKLGGLFISTEPLKAKEISEDDAEEIEAEDEAKKADAEAKKADADAEKSDAKKTEAEDEAEDDAKKADADAEKADAKTTKIGVGGGFKKPKKESEYVQLFYTESGKLLGSKEIEKIKNLPIGKNPVVIKKVERFTAHLEGGLSCGIEKVPKKAESRAFLHVMSKTLISKADADLYRTYCAGNTTDDPVIKVEKVYACLTDEYGLEKTVDIDNF